MEEMREELSKQIDIADDSINIYEFDSMKYSSKEQIGVNHIKDNIL